MTAEIHRALSHLIPPGAVFEIRIIGHGKNPYIGYFNDVDAAVKAIELMDGAATTKGIYVTLHEIDPALLARRCNRIEQGGVSTADTNILRYRWLPVDLDPVRPSDISATDAEKAAALQRAKEIAAFLMDSGFPDPCFGDSGNGAHLLYRIDLPNIPENVDLIHRCLTALDHLFSDPVVSVDTGVFNPARIFKVYGTMVRKGDSLPDRPHRRAALLHEGSASVLSRGSLEYLAGMNPPEMEKSIQKSGDLDLSEWLTKYGASFPRYHEKPKIGFRHFYIFDVCPWDSSHENTAFIGQLNNGALVAKCQDTTCGGAGRGVSNRWTELRERCEPPKEKKARGKKIETVEEPEADEPADPAVHEKALQILQSGDPVTHMMSVFLKDHVGDALLARSYIATIGCTLCANTSGIHPGTTGKSGAGKSHSMMTMLHQLPPSYVFRGSFSDQAWFYSEMLVGTVVFLDDASNLKDIHMDVIKQATSAYQEGFSRSIVDPKNRNVIKVNIPPRCTFWVNSADGEYELQFLNRQINLSVDETHIEDIFKKQTDDGRSGNRLLTRDEDWQIAREMWNILKGLPAVNVKIPFIDDLEWSNKENPRNWPMFQDTLSAFAAIRQFQRTTEDGYIVADRADAVDAMAIWNSISREQRTKLNEKQIAVMQKIAELMKNAEKKEILRSDLAKKLPKLTQGDITHILKGRRTPSGKYAGGLLNLVPGLTVEKISSKRESDFDTKHGEVISYSGELDIWAQFSTLVDWKKREPV